MSPRKNLVILRAGDGSLHRDWIAGAQRDFDLFISYYGKTAGQWQADAEYWEHRPGPKWCCIAELLAERPELLERYQAFWFPDDDLASDTANLNRMFALFHGFELRLAQPALTPDSYFSWKQVLRRPEYVLRRGAFVEVMAPLFSAAALRLCLGSFSQSRSGWGLDWIWPHLLDDGRDGRIAILDATPVTHTRPIGGELYKNNPELSPMRDCQALVARYGLQLQRGQFKHASYGVVRDDRLGLIERLSLRIKRLNARRVAARQVRKEQAR